MKSEIDPSWFVARERIGVTTEASAPEVFVQRVLDNSHRYGVRSIRTMAGLLEA